MTGFVQENNGKLYLIFNTYDENGRRKPKWISTGLPAKGNKRRAEVLLAQALSCYAESEIFPHSTGRKQKSPSKAAPRTKNKIKTAVQNQMRPNK